MILVHTFYCFNHLHVIAIINPRMNQCLYIFRETTATITAPCIKKLLTNTDICSNTFSHIIYISSHTFTQVGYVIHETDTCSKHGVSRIFCHFSRWNIHENNTEILNQERMIELSHHFFGLLTFNTNDHTVGTHEVFNSSSLFQKLRIRSHIKWNVYATFVKFFLDNSFHFFSSTYRNRTFSNQNGILINILTELTSYSQHIFQIGTTIFVRRSTYSGKYDLYITQNLSDISCEMQTVIGNITFNQIFKPWLIDWHLTIQKFVNLRPINIHAGNFVTHLCKTSAAY